MALISFGYRIDMFAIDPPLEVGAYIVAYDLDGVLKQKDHLGVVTLVGAGAGGPQGPAGPVGPAGLTWSGYWMATQSYSQNYAVGYGSASWWCISDVVGATSNSAPDVDTTHWTLLAAQGSPGSQGGTGSQGLQGAQGEIGINWIGDWIINVYDVRDAVYYNGSSYICIASTVGTETLSPDTNTACWEPMALKGDVGPAGATGSQGATGSPGVSGATGSTLQDIFYNLGGTVSATNSTTDIYRMGSLNIGTGTASNSRFLVSSSGGTNSLVVNEQGDTIFRGDTKIIGATLSTNSSIPAGSILFGTKTSIYSPADRQIIIGTDRSSTYNYTNGWKFTDYQITNLWGNVIEFQNTIGTIGSLFVGSSYIIAGYGSPASQKSTLFVKGTTASIMRVVGTGATWSNSQSIFEINNSGAVSIGSSQSMSGSKLFIQSSTSSTAIGSNVMLDLYNSSNDGISNMLSELAFSAKGQPSASDPYNNGHRYALISGYINQWNNEYSGGGLILSTRATTGDSLTERIRITHDGNIGIGNNPTSRFVVASSGGTVSLVVTEQGSVYNRDKNGIFSNLAFGLSASLSNTSGISNTAIGNGALYSNTNKGYNVAIGSSALYNSNADYNVAIGESALFYNTTGTQNNAIGGYSLYYNIGGSYNTAIGIASMQNGTQSQRNTGIGGYSLYNTTGSRNIGIGFFGGSAITTGSNNTVIGSDPNNFSDGLTTGSGNTFIGKVVTGITIGDNNTILGRVSGLAAGLTNSVILADGSGNIRFYSDSNGNVGLGTTSPSATSKVSIDLGTFSSTKDGVSIDGNCGNNPGYTGVRFSLLNTTATASGSIRMYRATGTTYLGMIITSQSRDGILFNTGTITPTEKVRITSDGNVGIGTGTASPSTKLHIYATASGAFRLEDGTQADGYILTSDTNGVGSWISSSFITGSGTASYIPIFSATGSILNSSMYETTYLNINKDLYFPGSSLYFSTSSGINITDNPAASGGGCVAIGYSSIVGNSGVSIGWYSNNNSTEGVAIGYGAIAGYASVAIGYLTNSVQGGDQGGVYIGYNAQGTGATNETAIGYSAVGNGSDTITLGNSSINYLYCNVGYITTLSDLRDKTNIIDIPVGLDYINSLRPVKFDWNRRDNSMSDSGDIGFIAQELDTVEESFSNEIDSKYTRLVNKNNPDKYTATPMATYPILVKAVQELSQQVRDLQAIVDGLTS